MSHREICVSKVSEPYRYQHLNLSPQRGLGENLAQH
jgi:hypothetical protein